MYSSLENYIKDFQNHTKSTFSKKLFLLFIVDTPFSLSIDLIANTKTFFSIKLNAGNIIFN